MRGSLLKVMAPEGRAGSDAGSTVHSSPDSTASHTERDTVVIDKESYAYRYGLLSMQARLFLLGWMPRPEFVRLVNAAVGIDGLEPIPEEPPK